MIGVRWIGAAAACAAMLLAGCSKGPRKASAGPVGGDKSDSATRPLAPSAPPRVVYPETGDNSAAETAVFLAGLGDRNAGAEMVAGPWAGATPGQYVTYRGAGGLRLTHKVVEVDADSVTVETSMPSGASRRVTHPLRIQAGHSQAPATARWENGDIEVGGRTLPCRVATWITRHGSKQSLHKIWLSDRVPGRLVRSERGDGSGPMKVVLELVRFGP